MKNGYFSRLQLRLGDLSVTVLNTHLESAREHGDARRVQMRECMRRMEEEMKKGGTNEVVVLAGDFNIRDDEV